jgi:D-alanine-D-alanine ligase
MANIAKHTVAIIFGGKSAEHEVSVRSAKNVLDAIDQELFEPFLIGIAKDGSWHLQSALDSPEVQSQGETVVFYPECQGKLISLKTGHVLANINVAFPILHGPFGEDGTIQGLLKLAGIPFVGASVLGSAVGMDKDVMKRLLREAGIPVCKFLVFTKPETADFSEIENKLGIPFFIKPANLGSSVGISKIKTKDDFQEAVKAAFKYDRKIIVEEMITGREIECSVLGNENPLASIPGEILVHDEFYNYNAKYIDESGASMSIPADIDEAVTKEVQDLAIKTYQTLCCEGLARVDFFLRENGELLINEINTIPGFTSRSMYPLLCQESGISYRELITRLINLAFNRFASEQKLLISR